LFRREAVLVALCTVWSREIRTRNTHTSGHQKL
jgi:hypothetical protein